MMRSALFHVTVDDFLHPELGESGEPRNPDDEITIEAPVPEIPRGVPSPIGDEDNAPATEREAPTLPPAARVVLAIVAMDRALGVGDRIARR